MKEGQSYFSDDTNSFLYTLFKHDVKYLIVGGEAVIYYGLARLTGDIDIYFESTDSNATALFSALNEFWDNDIPGIPNHSDLLIKDIVFQFGLPPNRIDLMNSIEGIIFQNAWEKRTIHSSKYNENKFTINYIGLSDLIINKEKVGRYKDKDDLRYLRKIQSKK